MHKEGKKIEQTIVEKAQELGASLAGIASIEDLKASPFYQVYADNPFYETYDRDSPNHQKFKGVN